MLDTICIQEVEGEKERVWLGSSASNNTNLNTSYDVYQSQDAAVTALKEYVASNDVIVVGRITRELLAG